MQQGNGLYKVRFTLPETFPDNVLIYEMPLTTTFPDGSTKVTIIKLTPERWAEMKSKSETRRILEKVRSGE